MSKNIEDRVKDSFQPDDKDSLKYYLDALTVAWKDHADGIRRSAALMVVIMAIFELLLKGSVKQVAVGPFALSNATTLLAFMPAGVAYFYYEALNKATAFEDIGAAYSQVFGLWNQAAEKNDLAVILEPRAPAFFHLGSQVVQAFQRKQLGRTELR